jgi:hypothetical protein
MFNPETLKELNLAAKKLVRDGSYKLFLTNIKNDCIQELTRAGASPDELVEANRRYSVADELESRIETHANWTDTRT